MRIATLLPLLLVAGCAPQRPTLGAPPVENPRDIEAPSWQSVGATSIAHRTVGEDGIVAAWVKTEPPVRRTATNGEPNFAPVQRQQFAWVEADCRNDRLRRSRLTEYADGAIVRSAASARAVGWRAATGASEYVFRLVCDGVTAQGATVAAR